MPTKTTKKPAAKKAAAVKTSLVLRVSGPNGESHGGFVWPLTVGAEVVCADWEDNTECGNGLHGWLYGQGDHSVAPHNETNGAKWMVLEVVSDDIRMLGGKVKFPRCTVRFVGGRPDAAAFLIANEPRASTVAVIGTIIGKGDGETANVGAYGSATSGYGGTSTSGYGGTSTSGDGGTSTSGYGGTSTSGSRGTSTSGDGGTSTSGDGGEIRIRYWDSKAERYRTVIGYIGEDGLEPNVAYRLDANNKFIKAN